MAKSKLQVVVDEMNRRWRNMYGKRGRFHLGLTRRDEDILGERLWTVVLGHRDTPNEWIAAAQLVARRQDIPLVPFAMPHRRTGYICAGCLGSGVAGVGIGNREIPCVCREDAAQAVGPELWMLAVQLQAGDMTGAALEALVLDEIRRARLRLQHEIRRNSTGLYLVLWSDWAWMTGLGGRRFLGHDDIRRRESNIGILTLHSRAPTILFGGQIGGADPLQTLHPPPRCRVPVLRALVFHAIAATVPTVWRLREARRRLRAVGVKASDFRRKPTFGRRIS